MGKTSHERFESPRFLANWAHEEINDLDQLFRGFFDADAYTVVEELNQQTGYLETKLRGLKPQPAKWRGMASNTIKNLKDALDQATFHASAIVSGKESRNTHFPFGESPDDLEDSLSGKKAPNCKGIPAALYPVLRRCEPYPTGNGYPGGNDALRLLARVAGEHKHRITLDVAPRILNWRIVPPPGSTNVVIRNTSSWGNLEIMKGVWDPAKNEMLVMRVPPDTEAHVEFQFSFGVTFGNSALKGVPAVPFMQACQAAVAKIVDDLEAEAIKLAVGG
jgi:hypothetical protein